MVRMARKTVVGAAIVSLFLALFLSGGCGGTPQDGNGGNGGGGGDPLRDLTLEQKVGQLFLVGFEGKTVTPQIEQWFQAIHPGGVILFARNIADEAQLAALVSDLQELARADSGLPLFVAVDQEGGEVARIGWLGDDTPQSRMGNAAQAYKAGLARAQGLSPLGINLNLAPVLDMGAPGDFLSRYGRTFPGTAQEVGELGAAVISGQREGGILSAAKHFPGYGGIDYDPENERLAVVPGIPEISQFQVAAAARTEFVMTANVIYTGLDPDLPFTLSPAGIAFLRENVSGDYLILSDDLATAVLKQAYSLAGTVTQAVKAGVDVLLVSGHEAGDTQEAFAAVLEAVRSGEIPEEEIGERASGILQLKQSMADSAP